MFSTFESLCRVLRCFRHFDGPGTGSGPYPFEWNGEKMKMRGAQFSLFVLLALVAGSLQLTCPNNGRQTNNLYLTTNTNPYLYFTPPRQGATTDTGLFYQDITIELFVKLPSIPPTSFHPLIGNMDGDFTSNMGVASGWRLACKETACCFQAFIGYKFAALSSGFDTQFLNDRRTLSFQQVCTVEPVPIGTWFQLAATYASETGQATIFINGTIAGQTTFTAIGDPDFGFDTSLLINYDYLFTSQVPRACLPPPSRRRPAAVAHNRRRRCERSRGGLRARRGTRSATCSSGPRPSASTPPPPSKPPRGPRTSTSRAR